MQFGHLNQLYFASTLQKLSEMGVKDVQISAIGDIPAEKQKEALDNAGIKVCVTHKSLEKMTNDQDEVYKDKKRKISLLHKIP